jgi:hypothetical protein
VRFWFFWHSIKASFGEETQLPKLSSNGLYLSGNLRALQFRIACIFDKGNGNLAIIKNEKMVKFRHAMQTAAGLKRLDNYHQ